MGDEPDVETLEGAAIILSFARTMVPAACGPCTRTSTPSGARFLGVELDPSLAYRSDSFRVALDYAALAPGAAFDNPETGATASAAQLVRLRLGFHY